MQDAMQFNAQLQRCATLRACTDLFRAEIEPLRFQAFACREVDTGNRSRTIFYVKHWPSAVERFYQQRSRFAERNPVLDAVASRQTPFTWADLRAERSFARAGQDALDMLAAQGLQDAFVVPLPAGGSRVGIVSMSSDGPVTRDPAIRSYLSIIAALLHGRSRALGASDSLPAPPMGLTEREFACLRLVARGMSDMAIGKTLGIAASTAHEYIEKAKSRLDVRSRPELTAVVASFGIIDVPSQSRPVRDQARHDRRGAVKFGKQPL